jgi:hypothetical protein
MELIGIFIVLVLIVIAYRALTDTKKETETCPHGLPSNKCPICNFFIK